MTDNEIIKNAELCLNNSKVYSCGSCAYLGDDCDCVGRMLKDLLDLFNRQKAEITELQHRNSELEIELKAMRGAANSYKAEVKRLTKGIVHCADCQHCYIDYADQGFGYPTKPIRVCIIHDHETTLDDYCSWARRKDGDE